MKRKGQIIIGLALILIFILMALAAPVLAPNDPNATNLALKNAPPSAEYPLGCDQMGRCELSRLLYGARYSMGLTIPVLIVLAAFALFVGCYSSYKGGLLDEVMRILCDILMAFPLIVIAMALVSAVDNSVASVIIAIGISMLAWFLRMVRSYPQQSVPDCSGQPAGHGDMGTAECDFRAGKQYAGSCSLVYLRYSGHVYHCVSDPVAPVQQNLYCGV